MQSNQFSFVEGTDYTVFDGSVLTEWEGSEKVLKFLAAGNITINEADDPFIVDEYATKLLPQIKAWDGISKVKIPADALKA